MRRHIVLVVLAAMSRSAAALGDGVAVPVPPVTLEQQLAEKISQRDQLEREIEAITQALRGGEQVLMRLEVWELNLTKMRQLGFGPAFEPGRELAAEKRGELLQSLANLRKNNLAKLLMNPTLVTVSGRPASVASGDSEQVVATTANGESEIREYGTRVEVLPLVQADGRLRLEMRPKVSQRGGTSDARASDGSKVPVADVAESFAACDVQFGDPVVVAGPIEQRTIVKRGTLGPVSETTDIATVVVVTAERVTTGLDAN